jgi:phosphoribosyl-ATP pyrophosphohydrolase/phosphoribosyl-AMP cyclohydrolase/histidinol dehydrogenase
VETGRGVYWSRRRGLWEKGLESGNVQELVRVELDCDRDALRFTVRQHGPGFCHLGCTTCWGPAHGVDALAATLAERVRTAPVGSYSRRLLDDPALLRAKLVEEAGELADATEPDHVVAEAADNLYFLMVALARAGRSFADVEAVLDRRARVLTRRPGNAKP